VLLQRLQDIGFDAGLELPARSLGPMHRLTPLLLLQAFGAPPDARGPLPPSPLGLSLPRH
jgi:hypothetical protein